MNYERLQEAYRWCDHGIHAILKHKKMTPCCREGCDWCCSEPTYVHATEVEHMLQFLTPDQREIVRQNTRTWLERAQRTGMLQWRAIDAIRWREQEIVCPFLHEHRCLAYDQRPFACRSFFAVGNPLHCQMVYREGQTYIQFGNELMARLCAPQMALIASEGPVVTMRQLGVWLAERLLGVEVEDHPKKMPSKPVLHCCEAFMRDTALRLESMKHVGLERRR